jgi:hypothetical protein
VDAAATLPVQKYDDPIVFTLRLEASIEQQTKNVGGSYGQHIATGVIEPCLTQFNESSLLPHLFPMHHRITVSPCITNS